MQKTILVLEDWWQDRALITSMLESTGYAVLNVTDGAEAMRGYLAHRDGIALIVIGSPIDIRETRSFAEQVFLEDPRLPIFSKNGDRVRPFDPPLCASKRLKPLSLMTRILRTLEGTLKAQPEVNSDYSGALGRRF